MEQGKACVVSTTAPSRTVVSSRVIARYAIRRQSTTRSFRKTGAKMRFQGLALKTSQK